MSKSNLRILQVSTYDIGGGAEKIAWDLFQSYRDRGYISYLVVGSKKTNDKNIIQIPNDENRSFWSKFWIVFNELSYPMVRKRPIVERYLSRTLMSIGQPHRSYNRLQGREDFDYPGTEKILKLVPDIPDILHCHNLHGNYFDLRALPWLSQQLPVVLTLHDAWFLSGHCAHSFDCEKWKIGCGNCPDLTIYPKIKKDATTYNWKIKKEIYAQSHLYVVTPCKWLMDKVNESILKSGIVDSRIIPNGVDTGIFQPHDRNKAREELGLPLDKKIILFTANGIRNNRWKDYETLKLTLSKLSDSKISLLCIALGEDAPREIIGEVEIKFVPFQKDPRRVARYYQAADVYVHSTKIDTFPNTILEALACGTPVVATNVGGIPEQIDNGNTGFLVPFGNANLMSSYIEDLLIDEELQRRMSKKASEDAQKRFDLKTQVNKYLEWYGIITKNWANEKVQ